MGKHCDKIYSIDREVMVAFAENIISSLKPDDETEWFKQNGLNQEDCLRTGIGYGPWESNTLSYYFIEVMGDVEYINFSDGGIQKPYYESKEYKRGIEKALMLNGYCVKIIGKNKIIFRILSHSGGCGIYAYYNKCSEKVVEKTLADIRLKVSGSEFLKGEKLMMCSEGAPDFLNFDSIERTNLILPKKTWDILDDNLFQFISNKESIVKEGMKWKRGILIWGPPGTGKTLLGTYICNVLKDVTVLWCTPSSVEDAESVKNIFEMARHLEPTIIFLEDMDFVAASRDDRGLNPLLGELLTQLDGAASNEGVFVVGTTNNPWALDKAISSRPSRFDVRVEFGLPDTETRERLYKLFLNGLDINYTRIISNSESLTASHIKEACIRGKLTMITKGGDLEKAILVALNDIKQEEFNRIQPKELVT